MRLLDSFLLGIYFLSCSSGYGEETIQISEAKQDLDGLCVHTVQSSYQAKPTLIRVLLPERLDPNEKLPVVFMLPVEAAMENRYGDGLKEVSKLKLQNTFRAVFVAPTFSHLPWYADHPDKLDMRQESYFLKVVVPFVEKAYPVQTEPRGRLLFGFSKSGWGAWSLLLRHPDRFGKAVAWDAPMMMDWPGKYGSREIFGSKDNFEKYHIQKLLETTQIKMQDEKRLFLLGYGNFREEHCAIQKRLDDLKIPHLYLDGPSRKHDWHSGWVKGGMELLLTKEN
jgi:S-formylglutathione hydrolase FrmB